MADLYSVTAPLSLKMPDGRRKVIAACFPHRLGLLYLDIFWHQSSPDKAAHLIKGELSGDGPWKIGGHIINVLGCQGVDPDLQADFSQWRDYLNGIGQQEYPPDEQIRQIAKRLGASLD